MSSESSNTPAILTRIFELASPFGAFAEPWDFLQPAPHIKGPVGDPDRALFDLRRRFTDDELVAAGVLCRDANLIVHLSPSLLDKAGALVRLGRDGPTGTLALLTAAGCLPATGDPLDSAFGDVFTLGRLQDSDSLIVCATSREVSLLRSLGFPCTLLPTAERLGNWLLRADAEPDDGEDPEYAELMARTCAELDAERAAEAATADDEDPSHAERPATSASDHRDQKTATECKHGKPPDISPKAATLSTESTCPDDPGDLFSRPMAGRRPRLIILGFGLLDLNPEPPLELAAICDYLTQLAKYLEITSPDIAVWRMSADEMEGLRFLLGLRQAKPVRDHIERSLATATVPLGPAANGDPKQIPSYAARWQAYVSLPHGVGTPNSAADQRAEAAQAVDEASKQVVARMLDSALANDNPRLLAVDMMLAHLMDDFLRSSRSIHELSLPDQRSLSGDWFERQRSKKTSEVLSLSSGITRAINTRLRVAEAEE